MSEFDSWPHAVLEAGGALTGNPPPIGYEEAKVGETFLKIGVGELEKPDETAYGFGAPYYIVTPSFWEGLKGWSWTGFRTEAGPLRSRAFRYAKRVELAAGALNLPFQRCGLILSRRDNYEAHSADAMDI